MELNLSDILTKHLTNLGQMWPKYLPLTTFAYNTFNTPNLGNYIPRELVFGRKPRSLSNQNQCPISRFLVLSKIILSY